MIPIVTGRNPFHVKYMRWSYRIRGKVPRTHTNRVAKIIVLSTKKVLLIAPILLIDPMNRTAEVILIKRMLVYSAIKIKANSPLLYSVLNPDTNSDSPSAKSKGDRLVSAREVVNHIISNGSINKDTHDF